MVVRATPLRRTCAPWTKLEPVTAREKLPKLMEDGEMPMREGAGLSSVTAAEADFVESAALVAVMEMVLGEVRTLGAV